MRLSTAVLAGIVVCGLGRSAIADDAKNPAPVLDKAIKALGGAEKLGAAKAVTWNAKGKISFGGNDNPFSSKLTAQGVDHFRQEFEGEFGGTAIKGATVVAGAKGWRKFGEDVNALENDALANEKRVVYLQVIPATILPLKESTYKVEVSGEEKVGDKPVIGVKITGSDGKEFEIFFDKESGLPLKQVAKVVGFDGQEFKQETLFSNYKDFDGIKRATKIESKRDGEKFVEQELSDFKIVEKVDPKTFTQPQ